MRYCLWPVLLFLGCAQAQPQQVVAQTLLRVAPFRSVSLSDGGEVVIRHGTDQRVTLVEGAADVSVEGTRLRIGKCRSCPRRPHVRIHIVTPGIDGLSVANGGRLVVAGAFPEAAQIAAEVSNGGVLDLRALGADHVTASVQEGGRILTRPEVALDAAVSQGGIILYWGDPAVRSSIRGGGVVSRGTEADLPQDDIAPRPPALPPHHPAPPVSLARPRSLGS